jgi:PAS domain S-box-containing protein
MSTTAQRAHEPFPGDSEMAALMRTVHWSSTPLGPPEGWPESLRTSVSICLLSRFPIVLFWGPDFVVLYNDGYRPMLGEKHPQTMGMPGRQVWSEIWPIIGPMLRGVMERGEATWSQDQLLFLERHGFPEECYFTFSYSPVPDGHGGVAGVFCAVTETTPQILRERRLALLRRLQVEASDAGEARRMVMDVLAAHPADVPFARFYETGAEGPAWLGEVTAPTIVRVAARGAAPGDQEEPVLELDAIPTDPWERPVDRAIAMPIDRAGGAAPWGVLVLGLAPRLDFDREYEDLAGLIAGALATVMSSAEARATERRRAEMLAELDRAKTTFFTNISHEFRTPLTLLMGPLDELATSIPDGDRERLDLARRNARRLYRLVNALLEFSRIEAGRVQATFEPVELAPLSSQLASMFRSAFDSGGVRLVIHAQPLPEPVYVDREMWERIVLNLVSNAFKHTYEGEVRVEVRADGAHAVLAVQDTGVGIAAEDLPRVFERFHRIDSPGARTHEGSGIGLALVEELVRLHGGTIEASSEVGKGTRFEVRIPFGSAHLPPGQVRSDAGRSGDAAIARAFVDEALSWLPPRPSADARDHGDHADEARPHVLVADDNADMRDYVRSVLEPDYDVEVATDGEDAFDRIKVHRPGIVLADVMMPRLDGYGLVGRIRADPETRTLPVVLLSARAGEDAAIEGLSSGADDYLVKPFAAGDLRARVAAHLATARLRAVATLDLREAEARFRTLVEHNPSGISLLDATGEITYSNPTWLEYLGGTIEDLKDRGWAGNIHPDDRDSVVRAFGQAVSGGSPVTFEYRCRRHDGAFRWFTTTLTPVHDAEGAVQSWIDVSLDIDDRKDAEQALRVALDRLQENEVELREALAAKDEFLSMVSHELRTPLTTILGNARVLAGRMRSLDVDAQGGALLDIADEAERLNQVIENLLVLARLEAGRTLELEPVLLARFVQGVVAAERVANPEREYRTAACDGGLVVIGNPDALQQVLGNLLSNARKYSPPLEPIDIACVAEDGSVAVTVADRGVGLDPDELERIFEPFYRSPRTATTSGIGIGLSVCRRLIEATGGSLAAAPREGGGAMFTVRLPIAPEDPEEAGLAEPWARVAAAG